MPKILILEDHVEIISTLKDIFEEENYHVDSEIHPDKVMEKIANFQPDVITLDISFSEERDEQGIAILENIRKKYSNQELPVIVISGTGDSNKLTRLCQLGIHMPYIHKPFEADKVLQSVHSAINTSSKKRPPESWTPSLEGESAEILNLIMEIDRSAKAQSDVLITGNHGSGKELVARKYRTLSPRVQQPFRIINCPTIPTELFEAEVFGYVKGAFDAANRDKPGMVEEAEGGIVFFDEFGELPLKHQAKLLRFMEYKTFQRLGENKERNCDVVILAATNRDLYKMVQDGAFREDLYFRLKSNRIHVPDLADRLSDLPLLIEHFIQEFNFRYKKNISAIHPSAEKQLQGKSWSGNVRQLEKCIGYGVIRCDREILEWSDLEGFFYEDIEKVKHPTIDENWSYAELSGYLKNYSNAIEREHVLNHLKRNAFNATETAKSLNLKQRTQLNEIMSRLDIDRKEEMKKANVSD